MNAKGSGHVINIKGPAVLLRDAPVNMLWHTYNISFSLHLSPCASFISHGPLYKHGLLTDMYSHTNSSWPPDNCNVACTRSVSFSLSAHMKADTGMSSGVDMRWQSALPVRSWAPTNFPDGHWSRLHAFCSHDTPRVLPAPAPFSKVQNCKWREKCFAHNLVAITV